MKIEWQTIADFPDYSVSNTGSVRRDTPWRRGNRSAPYLLSVSRDANGYAVVNLTGVMGKQRKHYVHRLVAIAFLGPAPSESHHVAHWDGNGMNAASSNLRWVKQAENEADKQRHGRDNHAPKGSVTFSNEDIASIRTMSDEGLSLRKIARLYGSNHTTVRHAINFGRSGAA